MTLSAARVRGQRASTPCDPMDGQRWRHRANVHSAATGLFLVDLPRVARVDRGTSSNLTYAVRQPTLGSIQAVASTW